MKSTIRMSARSTSLRRCAIGLATLVLLVGATMGNASGSPAFVPQEDSAKQNDASAPSEITEPLESASAGTTSMLGVAVVNLDRVAEALNRVEPVQKRMEEKKVELVNRLRLLNEGYQREISELMSKYGSEPTLEERREIAERQQAAIKSVEEAMKQGRNELSQYEQTLRQEFQDEVRPIAFQIAIDAGYPVVLTSSQVFAYRVGSPQDITERVIKHMRVQSPSQPSAALPELSTSPTKKR